MTSPRVTRALLISAAVLAIAILFGLWSGYHHVTLQSLRTIHGRALFFACVCRESRSLRSPVPRFRWWARRSSPVSKSSGEPFTLGVSGGGALGASVAIAFGWGARAWGVPLVFVMSFGGAMLAVLVVYRIARTGVVVLPGHCFSPASS